MYSFFSETKIEFGYFSRFHLNLMFWISNFKFKLSPFNCIYLFNSTYMIVSLECLTFFRKNFLIIFFYLVSVNLSYSYFKNTVFKYSYYHSNQHRELNWWDHKHYRLRDHGFQEMFTLQFSIFYLIFFLYFFIIFLNLQFFDTFAMMTFLRTQKKIQYETK